MQLDKNNNNKIYIFFCSLLILYLDLCMCSNSLEINNKHGFCNFINTN